MGKNKMGDNDACNDKNALERRFCRFMCRCNASGQPAGDLRAKSFEAAIFIPDLLLHLFKVVVLALKTCQFLVRGFGLFCKGGMQGPVFAVKLFELPRLFLQLLPHDLVAHGRGRTAGAASAGGGADRSAALGFQVSSGSACLGHGQSVRLRLAFQWVGSGFGNAVRLGRSFSSREFGGSCSRASFAGLRMLRHEG